MKLECPEAQGEQSTAQKGLNWWIHTQDGKKEKNKQTQTLSLYLVVFFVFILIHEFIFGHFRAAERSLNSNFETIARIQ